MPRQKIAHRIDERGGTYRLSHAPRWLDRTRYRAATAADFTIWQKGADEVRVTFNHGRGEFDDVGRIFVNVLSARAWIGIEAASGDWHVRAN